MEPNIMNYVLIQIANKNHSKNARHAAALYINDIKAFVRYILIVINQMMLSGRKSVTNSLPAAGWRYSVKQKSRRSLILRD
jgi:hypothetical protein